MSHIPMPQQEPGGQPEARTGDDQVRDLLHEILKELKVLSFHLAQITDEEICNDDTE